MACRSAPPPKPKSPTLTVGQKRRRVERLQNCVTSLEAFDPQKARKHTPTVLALEAAIDKALSLAFGYGTPTYLHYNQAATLHPSPLLTNATVRSSVAPPVGSARGAAKEQETRQRFSENKERSIAMLRKAITILEEEIADAESLMVAQIPKGTPVTKAMQASKATPNQEARALQHRRWGGVTVATAWRRLGRWWRGRN
jgi:hypothetical protein